MIGVTWCEDCSCWCGFELCCTLYVSLDVEKNFEVGIGGLIEKLPWILSHPSK